MLFKITDIQIFMILVLGTDANQKQEVEDKVEIAKEQEVIDLF